LSDQSNSSLKRETSVNFFFVNEDEKGNREKVD